MQFEEMQFQDFATWLRAQPADATYPLPACSNCPVGKFAGQPAAPGLCGMPRWADAFMDGFDAARVDQRNQATALRVLGAVESRLFELVD